MKNVYPFVDKPIDLKLLSNTPIYKLMQKLNAGGKLTTGIDEGFDGWIHKDEQGNYTTKPNYNLAENDYIYFLEHYRDEAYRDGIQRFRGYVFDFRPHFKKYLVKTKFCGWAEQWAPNKTFIRKCADRPSEILEIREY